jgi:hypothetical protein
LRASLQTRSCDQLGKRQVSQFVQTIQLAERRSATAATQCWSGALAMWWVRRTGKATCLTKERPEQKNDAAVTLMMAMGRALRMRSCEKHLGGWNIDLTETNVPIRWPLRVGSDLSSKFPAVKSKVPGWRILML